MVVLHSNKIKSNNYTSTKKVYSLDSAQHTCTIGSVTILIIHSEYTMSLYMCIHVLLVCTIHVSILCTAHECDVTI